jgi:hypothetical protein
MTSNGMGPTGSQKTTTDTRHDDALHDDALQSLDPHQPGLLGWAGTTCLHGRFTILGPRWSLSGAVEMVEQRGRRPSSASRRESLDPESCRIADQAVEDAWQELVRNGSPAAASRGKNVVCELMAQRVFSQVGHGVRDLDRLKQCALGGFLNPLGD